MELKVAAKVGLAAGLAAGLVLGLFVLLALEPLIAQAEAIEEAAAAARGETLEEPAVPPEVTKTLSVVGSVVVGLVVGIPFALVFPFVRGALPWRGLLSKAWVYGALAFVVFSLLPLLAVPGAPPGVERTPAVETRSFWYVAAILAGIGGLVAALGLYRLLRPHAEGRAARAVLGGVSLYVLGFLWVLPFLLKPEIGVVSDVPASLLETFALLTFAAWILFWSVLSTLTGLLWRRLGATVDAPLAGASA